MDHLTLFGIAAVTAMLVFYALEDRSPWFVLAFAVACALGSIYGFLQGAWRCGVVIRGCVRNCDVSSDFQYFQHWTDRRGAAAALRITARNSVGEDPF